MAQDDEKDDPVEFQPEWKKAFKKAWSGVKKATVLGAKKSQQLSQITKHQVKRTLLQRNRHKLYAELGEMTFHLLEDGQLTHEDLLRSFERIKSLNQSIREESTRIDDLRAGAD